MADMKGMDTGYLRPLKLSFPVDDAVYPWLSMLLDVYHMVDKGIAEAIIIQGQKMYCHL